MYIQNKIELEKYKKDFVRIDISSDNLLKEIRNSIKNNIEIIFEIDFNKKSLNQIINLLLKVEKKFRKHQYWFGTSIEKHLKIIANITNVKTNDLKELSNIIKIIMCNTIKEKYDYIYDEVCSMLDENFLNRNICEFNSNICIAKKGTEVTMGCCYHYENAFLDFFTNKEMILCKYQNEKSCSIKCIGCKLFTCDYLNKKGIKFKMNDILLLKYFFNNVQKLIIKLSVFTEKETIVKRLLIGRYFI